MHGDKQSLFRCWPRFNLPLCIDTAVLPLPLRCRPLLSYSKMPSFWKYFSVKWVAWSPPYKVNSFYVKQKHALTCSWASLRNKSCEPLNLGPVIHASNRRYLDLCLEFSSWKILKLTLFSSEQICCSSPGHLSHCKGGTVSKQAEEMAAVYKSPVNAVYKLSNVCFCYSWRIRNPTQLKEVIARWGHSRRICPFGPNSWVFSAREACWQQLAWLGRGTRESSFALIHWPESPLFLAAWNNLILLHIPELWSLGYLITEPPSSFEYSC